HRAWRRRRPRPRVRARSRRLRPEAVRLRRARGAGASEAEGEALRSLAGDAPRRPARSAYPERLRRRAERPAVGARVLPPRHLARERGSNALAGAAPPPRLGPGLRSGHEHRERLRRLPAEEAPRPAHRDGSRDRLPARAVAPRPLRW